jgi:hypothetical protein
MNAGMAVLLCMLFLLPQEEPSLEWDWIKGVRYVDPSRSLELHAGGLFAADYVHQGASNRRSSRARLDRALLRMDGRIGDAWEALVEVDLKGTETRFGLNRASISWKPDERFHLSAGLLEIGAGGESSVPEEDLSFTNYSFPIYLDGKTDWALRVDGGWGGGFFHYYTVVSAGAGFDRFGQARRGPGVSARVLFRPGGFHVELGGSWSFSFEGELDVANPADTKLFDVPELDADAAYFVHVTTGVDAAWFRFRHEFVVGSLRGVETSQGKMNFLNQITSWSATLSCMLSGEPYDGRPLPGGEERGAGSWEIALRYANADIDRRFFEFGLTDYDRSSQEFRSFCGAVNWRPLRAVRVTAEGIRTIADQHPSGFGGSGRDTAFVFRVEFRF